MQGFQRVSSRPLDQEGPSMHRIRGTFGYADVVSTIFLVLLLGGGTAYAATRFLPANSVGSAQLKKGAVTPAKLSPAAKAAMTGATGPQGPKGEPGPRGEVGLRGESGSRGEAGQKGDTGAKGDTGPQGDPGAKGEAGPRGDMGAKGDAGAKGDQGDKGEKGDQGDVGPTGPSDVYSAREVLKGVNSVAGNVTVVSLSLPAGNYLVSVTQSAESEG